MTDYFAATLLASMPLVIGELLSRNFGIRNEYARKTVHVLGSLAAVSLLLVLNLTGIAIMGALFSMVLLAIRRRRLMKSLYQISRTSYGEIFFPLGILAAALLAPTESVYIAGILVVGFADTAASIIGQHYGTTKLPLYHSRKSLQGSLAFWLVALPICLWGFDSAGLAVLAALAATAAEALSFKGADNLTVPVVICLVAQVG